MSVKITGDDRLAGLFVKLAVIGTPKFQDKVVSKEAALTFGDLVTKTPKKWFGQVRGAWQIEIPRVGARLVVNDNRVMKFLELGTRAHGPKTARALYIPLTRRAVNANREGRKQAGSFGGGKIKLTRQTVRKGKKKNRQVELEYGVDYVLAKRVKGIKAMHIVKKQSVITERRLLLQMKLAIRNAIA